MKSVFASAMIATAVSGIKPVSVPEYVAGFVYGMGGANHLDEFTSCFKGGQDSLGDIKKTLEDLKSGAHVKLALDVKKLRDDLKSELTLCQNMDEDLALIDSWAD